MSVPVFYYSCGHQGFDQLYDPNRERITRCVDYDCLSCQKKEYMHAVHDYAARLEECGDEEWEANRNAFLTLINEIEAGHPDWTYETVEIEAERQAVEAFKARQPRGHGIPEIVKTPAASESAEDQGRSSPPEWIDGQNDEIVRDQLHPVHALVIIKHLENQQNPSWDPEPNDFDFDAEDPEDAEDAEDAEVAKDAEVMEDAEDSEDVEDAQVMASDDHHPSWIEEPRLGWRDEIAHPPDLWQ